MQREKQKKRKAEEKRKRRLERKSGDAIVSFDGPGENELDPVDATEQDTVEDETASGPIKPGD